MRTTVARRTQDAVEGYLDRLTQPVEIVASLDDGDARARCSSCSSDIAALVGSGEARGAPRRRGAQALVRLAGAGGRGRRCVSPACRWATSSPRWCSRCCRSAAIRRRPTRRHGSDPGLEGEYRFETFVSLSCQSCPDVVQALNLMAVLNPNVRHTMIDGALFQDEVERRGSWRCRRVLERPAVRPGPHVARGDPREARFRRASRGRALLAKAPFDVLVVGGGPAGAAAAIYAARKGSAPASRPSGSAASCSIRSASRISSR
jgi:NADH-dependent peroxiredoxin subunit F